MARYILKIEMEYDEQTQSAPRSEQLDAAVNDASRRLPGRCVKWGLSGTTPDRELTGFHTIKDLPIGDFRTKES